MKKLVMIPLEFLLVIALFSLPVFILGRSTYLELRHFLHQDIIDEILKKLISKNIGIEVNTSGLRYGLKNFHPHINILKRYKKFGGEIITIGSDSHRSEDIMKDFDIVKKLLKELGFNSYCTFKNKKIEYRDLDI